MSEKPADPSLSKLNDELLKPSSPPHRRAKAEFQRVLNRTNCERSGRKQSGTEYQQHEIETDEQTAPAEDVRRNGGRRR